MLAAAEILPAGPVVLRRWCSADAEALHAAVTASLDHLAPWMAWVAYGYPLEAAREFLAHCDATWGIDHNYAITTPGRGVIAGSCSMMGRIGPGGFEIGYWVHPGHVQRGYAGAAAAALAIEAFRIGADRVEIVHDAANTASGAIPRRLGFTEVDRRPPQERVTSAEAGVDVVWRMRAPG